MADDGQGLRELATTLNRTVELVGPLLSGSRIELAIGLGNKAVSLGDVATASGVGGETLRSATFVGSQGFATIGMGLSAMKLASNPVAATLIVGLEMSNKIVGTMGYAGFDRCGVALAGLGTTAGLALTATFATGGLAAVFGVASVALQAWEVQRVCKQRDMPAEMPAASMVRR